MWFGTKTQEKQSGEFGDARLDGIIKENTLGLELISLQAKKVEKKIIRKIRDPVHSS